MRVLYVLRYWPTRSETFVAREIAALIARGHVVVVAAIGTRSDGVGLDPVPGLEVWRPPRGLGRVRALLPERTVRQSHPEAVGWLEAHQRPRDVSRACWTALRAREAGFDRVHAHFAGEAAEWALLVARVAGLPFSVTVHASDLFQPRPSLPALLAAASPVVTVCEHHVQWMRDRYGAQAVVVRSGVDPGAFPVRGVVDGPLRVVCVARWVPKKGLDDLLQAVDLVPESVTLRLICDAPARVASARVQIGPLPPDAVAEALSRADVFALPCRIAPDGDRDGVPVSLIEAMASGLPVITTAVSGIGELVDASVGWLVPPQDPSALAQALIEAMDPAERRRRGRAGRARVEAEWTLQRQVNGLLAAWGSA